MRKSIVRLVLTIERFGESLRDNGDAPVLVEACQACGLALMSRFHAIQVSLPGGTTYGGKAMRADGIDGSILVHAVGKLEV